MRQKHADPSRKLLLWQQREAEQAARKVRPRGKRWGHPDDVYRALVGNEWVHDLICLLLAIYTIEDEHGTTEGYVFELPKHTASVQKYFASLGFITFDETSGKVRVVERAFGDAYEAMVLRMARREVPDNFDPTSPSSKKPN